METIAYKVGSVWTEIDFTSLGVGARCHMTLGTHGESKFTIPFIALPPEVLPAIPFETPCVIYTGRAFAAGAYSGGTILFQGRRTDNSGQASGSGFSQEIVIEDAWYDLAHITFQCEWPNITGYSGSTPTYGTPFTWPDCVLFQMTSAGQLQPNGTFAPYLPAPYQGHITTGQAIKEILAYAIFSCGVNLQIGRIDPACYVPYYPIRTMRCANAIKICLRVHPDCTCEIDYTTTPPTFNIRARANLTAITLPYKSTAANRTHLSSSVRPRPDLQPSRVAIYIKETTTVSGNPIINIGTDIYPALSVALRSFDASIDITGPKISKSTAAITSLAFDPTDLDWWQTKVPALEQGIPTSGAGALALLSTNISMGGAWDITVKDGTGADVNLATFAWELDPKSAPMAWMTVGGGPLQIVEATVTAWFNYSKTSTVGTAEVTDTAQQHQHHVRVKLVNSASMSQQLTQVLSTGEVYPPGLAQSIYTSLAQLQYNFSHTILELSFATLIKPGKHALNLLGGNAAWTAMHAMVQSVDYDLMFNPVGNVTISQTTVKCGPVEHLEAGELVQLFNLFANRDLSKIDPNERLSGSVGTNLAMPNDAARENSIPAQPIMSTQNLGHIDISSAFWGIKFSSVDIAHAGAL